MGYVVSSGEISSGIILSSYDSMFISSGGVANRTTIKYSGFMYISSSGTANSTTTSGGSIYIYPGGVANSTTINDWGYMDISFRGMANSTTINSGGDMRISSGGTATDITENGGYVYVADGAYATFVSNTIEGFVLSYGSMTVHKNTIANNTTINSGGSMYIYSGGTTNSTTINYGRMNIYSGGTATDITENGGYVYVADGAYVTFASNTIEGIVLSHGSMTVHKNTIANYTTIYSGSNIMDISSGGTANNTTIHSGGRIAISSGGIANSTTIHSGGAMRIYPGGTAINIIASVNAKIGITVASNTYIQGTYNGSAFKMEEAFISGYTIHSDCDMIISSGGAANNTTIHAGGSMTISSGGTANSTTINGCMYISSGGTANSTTINGRMYIYSGGTANSTIINSGCAMVISSGGMANSTTVNSWGSMYISSGGTATDITAKGYAKITINVASNTYIQGTYGGSAFEMKDAFISGYTINYSGQMTISSGGMANSTTVNSWGSMYISSGGTANNTAIKSSGRMYIKSGGTANCTAINLGGSMVISSGGTANCTKNNGMMTISSGGIANSTTINSGYMYISSGGTANKTTIHSGGRIAISSGGTANDTTINDGRYMRISSGGTANRTTINSGYMYISSGGIHRGSLQMESGAYVSAYFGAIIGFTVADRTSADDYLINDLSLIKGMPTYTITVSEDQTSGTYKLAQGASALKGTISICTEDTCFGELTVNGDVLTIDGVTYDLNNVDGNLTLTITVLKPEYIVGNFNGMFELTPDGNGTIYTPSGKQEIAGTIDPESWELAGAGDFNKSGTDGLLWIEKDTGYVYVQNDLTNFDEVKNKANCLGVLGEGYHILNTGDFTGTGISGVVMQGPAFGDASISLNYGLPIWGREADGTTFAGWLGALVNTWQPGDTLKGDTSDLADINAKNYMYEVVSVGDYNGDGVDDVMLQNIMPKTVDGVTITGSGDVFTFLTGSMDAVKAGAAPTVAYAGCATDGWEIVGTGDFDSDGIDDVLLSDGTGVAGWKMVNGQRSADLWFGNLGETEEISGITDLNNDGTDDILILNTATDTYSGWLVKDGVITGSLAIA